MKARSYPYGSDLRIERGNMITATIKKIGVHHIIDGVHTDECEEVFGWDTIWNPDLKRDMEGTRGLWQCPHCECVRDRDSSNMITFEEYEERYL